jgi:hypothetical protein
MTAKNTPKSPQIPPFRKHLITTTQQKTPVSIEIQGFKNGAGDEIRTLNFGRGNALFARLGAGGMGNDRGLTAKGGAF